MLMFAILGDGFEHCSVMICAYVMENVGNNVLFLTLSDENQFKCVVIVKFVQ